MVDRGKTKAVRALLKQGADPNVLHPDGRTLLQLATDKNYPEIIALFETDETQSTE
jgi:ankyrin repeat protein